MKTFRRLLLVRRLRAIKREIDYVYQVRRETVQRESLLRNKADTISTELMHMEIHGRA